MRFLERQNASFEDRHKLTIPMDTTSALLETLDQKAPKIVSKARASPISDNYSPRGNFGGL